MSRLVIFLSAYFCIFGLIHLYLLVKTRRAFYLHGVRYFLLTTVLLFLMLAPIQSRILDAQGLWLPSLVMAWIGYLWLGFLFLFVCLALPLDIYHLIVKTGQNITGADWTAIMLSRRQSLGLVVLVTTALMIYGAFEARQIHIERITLKSPKIPASMSRIRLVQISDLHLGPMTYPGRMDPIIEAIRKTKPDILVSTGDLLDGKALSWSSIAAALREIPAPMGKYAVLGNHEYYHGIESSLKLTQEAGFVLLRHQTVTVDPVFTIAGADDAMASRQNPQNSKNEALLLAGIPVDRFVLLLKHRPSPDPDSRGMFDLQLSGHLHGGQIFPFGYLVSLRYPVHYGLTRHPEGSHVYISRGTGTWGPPVRLLAPAEITVIDLVPAAVGDTAG